MSDQGKANYEGFHAAIPGSSPVPFDDLPHIERLHWDAGATSVELWLAEAPVDEDMPGNEPEAAKVFVVIDDTASERRHEGSVTGITPDGSLAIGERDDRDKYRIEPTTLYAPGRWLRAYADDGAPDYRALLARAVRELDDSGSPGQNRLAAELARDGGIEL